MVRSARFARRTVSANITVSKAPIYLKLTKLGGFSIYRDRLTFGIFDMISQVLVRQNFIRFIPFSIIMFRNTEVRHKGLLNLNIARVLRRRTSRRLSYARRRTLVLKNQMRHPTERDTSGQSYSVLCFALNPPASPERLAMAGR